MRRAFAVLLVLLSACGHGAGAFDYRKEPDPRRSEYVIGVSDLLSIQVWNNAEVSREVTVRPDGTITLPLIGDLTAAGKTPSQLKQEVTTQLARYVRDEGAVVTVAVSAVNSYGFTVSGNVERPGVYGSQKYVTVLEAIQLAGGPNRFASPRKTKLMRRDRAGNLRVIPIDYTAVLEGRRPEANLALLAGDQLHVP
jgi:polysaccharide export outer membrane protein